LKVIVCNIGSTSFKFQLIDMAYENVLARVHIERVGSVNARVRYYRGMNTLLRDEESPVMNQRAAVQHGLDFLKSEIVGTFSEVDAVGFKTIQAGEENGSVLLTEKVQAAMENYVDMAPAHNPPYLEAIRMFAEIMPGKKLVGVFEPGFHVDKPEYASVYGTPYEWYEKYGVKKYGFHGASLRFLTGETVNKLNLDPKNHKIVACHLGGSSSVCAYKNGISIDTSMGFSAQTGVMQSGRTGDIDAYIVPYIMRKKGIGMDDALDELSNHAGMKGLSGTSGDMRDVHEAIASGSKQAKLAFDKYVYDIKCYVGSYIYLMGGIDAICFSGGTGMNDPLLRAEVLSNLGFLGFSLNTNANEENKERIDAKDSKIAALVIDTNEEIIVARETVKVVNE
jgi:acetate kinase